MYNNIIYIYIIKIYIYLYIFMSKKNLEKIQH